MIPKAIRRTVELLSYFQPQAPAALWKMRLGVSPGSALICYKSLNAGHWNELCDFAESYVQVNDVVWDVRANMGVFTFAAAHQAGEGGRVLALEPDPWSERLLRRSIRQNIDCAIRVDTVQVAISGAVSLGIIHISERGRAASHLAIAKCAGPDVVGGIREKQLVISISLDWLAERYVRPQVLKIDVDGAEMKDLAGGEKLILEQRPIILTEFYERNADAVTKFLGELGYSLFDFNVGMEGEIPITRAVYNTLAIPEPLVTR